jgi:hypothetical protein
MTLALGTAAPGPARGRTAPALPERTAAGAGVGPRAPGARGAGHVRARVRRSYPDRSTAADTLAPGAALVGHHRRPGDPVVRGRHHGHGARLRARSGSARSASGATTGSIGCASRQQVRAFEDTSAGDLARTLGAGCRVDRRLRRRGTGHRASRPGPPDGPASPGAGRRSPRACTRSCVGTRLHLVTLEGVSEEAPRLALGRTLYEASFEANAGPAPRQRDRHRLGRHDGRTRGGRREPGAIGAHVIRDGTRLGARHRPTRPRGRGRSHRRPGPGPCARPSSIAAPRRASCSGVSRRVTRGCDQGAPVEVEGVDARFAGRYVVVEAEHTIDAERGYLCRLSSAPPEPRTEPAGPVHAGAGGRGRHRRPGRAGPGAGHHPDAARCRVVMDAGADRGRGRGQGPRGAARGGRPGCSCCCSTGTRRRAWSWVACMDPMVPYDTGIEGGRVRRTSLRTPGGQLVRLDDEAGHAAARGPLGWLGRAGRPCHPARGRQRQPRRSSDATGSGCMPRRSWCSRHPVAR